MLARPKHGDQMINVRLMKRQDRDSEEEMGMG